MEEQEAGGGIITDFLDAGGELLESASPRESLDSMNPELRNKLQKNIIKSPSVYSYPTDLNATEGETELVHSVVFNILARENSRVAQIRDRLLNFGGDGGNVAVDTSDQNRTTGENAKVYLGTTAAIAAGTVAYTRVKNLNKAAKDAGGLAANFIGGAAQIGVVSAAGGLAASLTAENVTTVDINTAIELYVTQPPIAEYSASWENAELGALGGTVANADINQADLSLGGILRGLSGVGELGVRGIIGAAASLPSALGITGDLAAGIEATSKKVANPYREQLFKKMGFRKFAFSYKFAPRNSTELQTALNIIQQFKYHMHPENDINNLFLEYPSEFDIEYRYKGKRNEYLSRISTCALTDMKVTYGGQDAFTSFIDTEGAPSEFQMDLVFAELETLTNDRIGLDYKDSL